MEKETLIPIIVVLGILTLGIGIYIYIRCKTKPVETLQEVVITEEINQNVENSIDNTTNVCNNSAIPVCDAVVIEEKKEDLDRIVRVGKLRMTERARRELENGWQGVKQSYSTMMSNRIAAFDRNIDASDRNIADYEELIEEYKKIRQDLRDISKNLQEVANREQSSVLLDIGIITSLNVTTEIDPNIDGTNSRG